MYSAFFGVFDKVLIPHRLVEAGRFILPGEWVCLYYMRLNVTIENAYAV